MTFRDRYQGIERLRASGDEAQAGEELFDFFKDILFAQRAILEGEPQTDDWTLWPVSAWFVFACQEMPSEISASICVLGSPGRLDNVHLLMHLAKLELECYESLCRAVESESALALLEAADGLLVVSNPNCAAMYYEKSVLAYCKEQLHDLGVAVVENCHSARDLVFLTEEAGVFDSNTASRLAKYLDDINIREDDAAYPELSQVLHQVMGSTPAPTPIPSVKRMSLN